MTSTLVIEYYMCALLPYHFLATVAQIVSTPYENHQKSFSGSSHKMQKGREPKPPPYSARAKAVWLVITSGNQAGHPRCRKHPQFLPRPRSPRSQKQRKPCQPDAHRAWSAGCCQDQSLRYRVTIFHSWFRIRNALYIFSKAASKIFLKRFSM